MYQINDDDYIKHLPFVTKYDDMCDYNWFDVTSTGDEIKDYKIGSEYALLLLKVMRNHYVEKNIAFQKIIFSIINQDTENLHSIIEGFFDMLNHWTIISVKFSGSALDRHSYDEIIANINHIIADENDATVSHSSHLMKLLTILDV